MPVETNPTSIASLNAAWPTADDPKSDGDDHIRNMKTVLKQTFPAFTGPMTIAHDQVASKDYVNGVSFSNVLPGQSGNAGKVLSTDGTIASWQPGFPVQAGNAGKLLVSDGTNTSWGTSLKASVVRFADGTDATKLAAFDLSGLTTATTRTYALPDASGALGLRTDVLHVREEQASGTVGSAGVSIATGVWRRILNATKANSISGASVSANQVTLPAGKYRLRARSSVDNTTSGLGSNKTCIYNVTDSAYAVIGESAVRQSVGSGFSVVYGILAEAIGIVTITSTKTFEVRSLTQDTVFSWGAAVSTGVVEVYTDFIIEKI